MDVLARKRIETLEKELKTYKMYIQPLEDLVREMRARQHEFDNHMNAILNMHYVIDNYDGLVEAQSKYIKDMYKDDSRQLMTLLKISDKILAGFLYSKIISAPTYAKIKVDLRCMEIFSSISEYGLIEIIGTLVDNAFEAATRELPYVDIILDMEGNKLVFEISNQTKNLTLEQISKFFDKGYTTKKDESKTKKKKLGRNIGKHGLGLYNARKISKKYGGDVTVSLEEMDTCQKITLRLEI